MAILLTFDSMRAAVLSLVLSLVLVTAIRAQENFLENVSVQHGLPQSEVNAMHQDSRGYIWLGTNSGVAIYNGHNFRVYDQSNGLAGDLVTALDEDDEGRMWVGSTWGGVSWFDGLRWQYIGMEEGLNGQYVEQIVHMHDTVYVLTRRGVCEIVNMKVERCLDLENDVYHTNLLLIPGNRLLISSGNGIKVLDRKSFAITHTVAQGLGFIALNRDGDAILACAETGLYRLMIKDLAIDQDFSRQLREAGIPESFYCVDVLPDVKGNIWITSVDHGIYKYTAGEKARFFSSAELFYGARVAGVFQDREGVLWLRTLGRGVYKFMAKPFEKFQMQGYSESNIFGFEEDADGRIYFVDIKNGILRWDGQTIERIIQPGVHGRRFFDLLIDASGAAWLATDAGLFKYVNGTLRAISLPESLDSRAIRSLALDKEGRLLAGTVGGGVVIIEGDKVSGEIGAEELQGMSVHSLWVSKNGDVWIGTGAGLYRWDGDALRLFETNHGLCNSYVGNITEDQWGNIWVSTDNCISRLKDGRFTNYNRANGLSSNVIYILMSAPDGSLWVGTNNGLDKLSLDESAEIKSIKHYGAGEGFGGIECNSRASFIDKQGDLWFASIDGQYVYKGNLDKPNPVAPQLHLKGIQVFFDEQITHSYMKGKLDWFGLPDMLILPHYHNHLTFTVDGLNFAAPNDVRYAFRLEGADRNWTPYTAVNSWTYSNLSPGIYFFSVKAINADGVESVEPVFYGPIIIASKPDEYQIPYWAWMVIIMLAAGCLYAIVFFIANRERRLKKMRLMLEDKVKIRTAEVERQNQEKEVMLKEIHHRVKNNLQIINSLMNLQVDSVEDEGVKEVFREARNRIASMALIHEKIYENRMLVNIRMKDYIRELVHKLIESYRIGDNVRLNMNIGDDVVMNMNQIVPVGLILNEIISNSLKYAFPDQRKGRIIVEMTRDSQGYYVLTAGDDGVGLPAGFSVEKNRSLGMELIELLTDQLGGELKLDGTEGVRYTLRFKGQ